MMSQTRIAAIATASVALDRVTSRNAGVPVSHIP